MIRREDQDLFLEAGWMWPAYVQNRRTWDLLAELRAAAPADRRKVVERALPEIYTPQQLATGFLEMYSFAPIISEYATSIGEAIEAAMLGRFTAAVATLTPVIEGVLRRLGEVNGRDPGIKAKSLAKELDYAVEFERRRSYDKQTTDERVALIEGFRRFFWKRLFKYADTKAPRVTVELNRHGIAHALTRGWGNAANFYVLISIIDQLSFIVCMRTNGAPVLFPNDTRASRVLAAHYLSLRILGNARPSVGPSRTPPTLDDMTKETP